MPFLSPYANVQAMLLDDRHRLPWLTTQPLVFESALTGETYTVPANFRTDGASVPILLAALPIIGPALVMRYFGKGVFMGFREGVLHDWLRRDGPNGLPPVSADIAHKVFREALVEAGYPGDLVENYYAAVKRFNP